MTKKIPYTDLKASLVTLFFLMVGIYGWKHAVSSAHTLLPLVLFYLSLTINTFFSIRLFSRITPPFSIIQNSLDIILVILFVVAAFTMGTPLLFVFFVDLLFVVATIKYTFLLNTVNHPKLLKRKILIDLLGILACTATLGGILAGYQTYFVWIFSVGFIIANVLLFFVWVLYRLD